MRQREVHRIHFYPGYYAIAEGANIALEAPLGIGLIAASLVGWKFFFVPRGPRIAINSTKQSWFDFANRGPETIPVSLPHGFASRSTNALTVFTRIWCAGNKRTTQSVRHAVCAGRSRAFAGSIPQEERGGSLSAGHSGCRRARCLQRRGPSQQVVDHCFGLCLKLRQACVHIAALEVRPKYRRRDVDRRANRDKLQLNRRFAELLDATRARCPAIAHEGSRLAVPLRINPVHCVLEHRRSAVIIFGRDKDETV